MERKGVCSRKDLDDEGFGQSKMLWSFSGVKLPMVNYHAGFLALPTPGSQIFGYPPAFGSSKTALTRTLPCCLFFVISLGAFSSALRYLVCPVGCACFCLVESWMVGLAMSREKSKSADIAIGFFG